MDEERQETGSIFDDPTDGGGSKNAGSIFENGYCLTVPQSRHAPPDRKDAETQQAGRHSHLASR